jgi:hypothetical protein
MYTVYDQNIGDFPAKIPYIHRIYRVLANPVYVCTLCVGVNAFAWVCVCASFCTSVRGCFNGC